MVVAFSQMNYFFVMPGLVPGIHVLLGASEKTWMAGTSPAMTASLMLRRYRFSQ
jgi:hypothetical protein